MLLIDNVFDVEAVCGLLIATTESFDKPDTSSISDFSMSYHLDCISLLSGFHEDVEFHFSLGITSLMRRFLGHHGPHYLTSVSIWPLAQLLISYYYSTVIS